MYLIAETSKESNKIAVEHPDIEYHIKFRGHVLPRNIHFRSVTSGWTLSRCLNDAFL